MDDSMFDYCSKHFDTSTAMFRCECGEWVDTGKAQPDAGHALVVLDCCPNCREQFAGVLYGDGAYKMREDTLRLQLEILAAFRRFDPPMTVRQVFYQMTVRHAVPKTQAGYGQVQRQLVKMRRAGTIPYTWIADNSRYMIKEQMYESIGDALAYWQRSYRRDLWKSQPVAVEVWIEKDALAGVASPITDRYGVPLYVSRGYSSITFAHTAAEQMKSLGKPVYVYHFGDFDYDGVHAAYKIQEELSGHGANFHYERMAITPEQIEYYGLPSRYQKSKSTRRKWFVERYGDVEAVELDSLSPNVLRGMVEQCIVQHIDPYELERTQRIEQEEISTLATVIGHLQ